MDWIETMATIVQASAVTVAALAGTVAALAARRGLTTWRREMKARRRAELAEHTLAMFYEARDIISAARFPGSFGGEGSSRDRQTDETDDERRYRNALYVPVERLNQNAEFWGRFEAARYPFMAVFGDEAATHFQTVRGVRSRVIISAGRLVREHGSAIEKREDYQHRRERLENDIGWGLTEEDELAKQIEGVVSAIEDICRPAIAGATSRTD